MGAKEEERLRKELEEAKAALAVLRAESAHDAIPQEHQVEGRHVHLSPAPRSVPLASVGATLFGGPKAMIGYIFLAIGCLFSVIFVGNSELMTPIEFFGAKTTAKGQVVSIEYTGATTNGVPIVAVHAVFDAPPSLHYQAGGSLEAVGHTSLYHAKRTMSVGSIVAVEYLTRSPATARIVGLSLKMFPAWVAFVLIFPLLGLALAMQQLIDGLPKLRAFRHGLIAHGSVVERWATGVTVNSRPEMAYAFEFTVPAATPSKEGEYAQLTTRVTHTGLHNYRVLDEPLEPILYDPARPHVAMLVDGLPGGTFVNSEGQLEAPCSAWLHMMPPLAVVLVNWAAVAIASSL